MQIFLDANHLTRFILLLASSVLIAYKIFSRRPELTAGERARRDRYHCVLLLPILVASVMGYVNFGVFQPYPRGHRETYHYQELLHYFLAHKYYAEMGHTRLYDCLAVALSELRTEGHRTPEISVVRSLEDPKKRTRHLDAQTRARNAETCHRAFTAPRWDSFKRDLGVFLGRFWTQGMWSRFFRDHGNNSPPSAVVLPATVARFMPWNETVIQRVPFIDLALVFVVLPPILYGAFGAYPTIVSILVFSLSAIAEYEWTGGSFLRFLWIFYLFAGFSFLKMERLRLAGFFLGAAVADRIFPVLFLFGALVPICAGIRRSAASRRRLVDLLTGALGALALLVAASLLLFGMDHWREFFGKIIPQYAFDFDNNIGFNQYVGLIDPYGNRPFFYHDSLLQMFAWRIGLRDLADPGLALLPILRGASLLGCLLIAARLSPTLSGLLVGSTFLFFLSTPAHYYYAYLAIFPCVLLTDPARVWPAVRTALFLLTMLIIPIVQVLNDDFGVRSSYLSLLLFVFLELLLVSFLLQLFGTQMARFWSRTWSRLRRR